MELNYKYVIINGCQLVLVREKSEEFHPQRNTIQIKYLKSRNMRVS